MTLDQLSAAATELLPCPFCGKDCEKPVDATRIMGVWRIIHRCKIIGAITLESHDLHELIATWNTRTQSAAQNVPVLLDALKAAESAIAEYYRYWTGGETRGSYDGKPERAGLWAAQRKARAAIAQAQEPE